MPFVLLIIGVILCTAGVRNTQSQLFSLVKGDFTGSNNFIAWTLAILVIGGLGYIQPLRPLSRSFMVLVIVVLIIANSRSGAPNGGFFTELKTGLSSASAPSASTSTAPTTTN